MKSLWCVELVWHRAASRNQPQTIMERSLGAPYATSYPVHLVHCVHFVHPLPQNRREMRRIWLIVVQPPSAVLLSYSVFRINVDRRRERDMYQGTPSQLAEKLVFIDKNTFENPR